MAQLVALSNATFKMQNVNITRVRKNGVEGAATSTPVLQTTLCLHFEFCILNLQSYFKASIAIIASLSATASTVALPPSSARLAITASPCRANVTVSVFPLSILTVATSVGIFSAGSTRSWKSCARMFDSFVSMSSTFAVSTTLPAAFFQTSLPSLSFDRSNVSVSAPRCSSTREALNDRPSNMSLRRNMSAPCRDPPPSPAEW